MREQTITFFTKAHFCCFFFSKSCLKVGGAAYTRVFTVTQMNAAALSYDSWLRLLRVELFQLFKPATLKIDFFICKHCAPRVFLSFPLYPSITATAKKRNKLALGFTRLFSLLIGHFLLPKTHYFQNDAKCKTFRKKIVSL